MDAIQAERWAVKAMAQHGLIEQGWQFDFDNSRIRLGLCNHVEKRITISLHFLRLNDETVVKDTVMHEIAHALCAPGIGHGPLWKKKCLEIGAKPNRLAKTEEIVVPQSKYHAICGTCGAEHQRRVLPKRGWCHSCSFCDKRFNSKYLLEFTLNLNYKK